MCISLAMSSGLVKISLLLFLMQSSGGVSKFLKTFVLTFLGLFSYNWRYFDMAFLTQSRVCLEVMLRACLFAFLAISASVFSQSCLLLSVIGGGGISA